MMSSIFRIILHTCKSANDMAMVAKKTKLNLGTKVLECAGGFVHFFFTPPNVRSSSWDLRRCLATKGFECQCSRPSFVAKQRRKSQLALCMWEEKC